MFDINQEHDKENLIPVDLIKKEPDTTEKMECMEIDETSVKMETFEENIDESDPILENLSKLKICNECGIPADCIVQNKENGEVAYFCSSKCMKLNAYKKKSNLNCCRPRASSSLSSTSSTSSLSPTNVGMKINDASSLYVRVCSTCSAIIHVDNYSNISWQARDFCNEKCLTKHQVRFNSYCVECKSSIVDANNFGKFSMKFGNNIRTFCSKICLDKYKITLNMCQFCNNDISNDAYHKYLAPVTEHSSTFKQFCSIDCVKNYCQYKLKLPYQNEADNYAICAICNIFKFVELKFQHRDIKTYTFCSEMCYVKFQCYNRTDAVQCYVCKVLYDKIFFQRYCLYDNGVKNFCSQNCQTTYYIIARHIVDCKNCKVKKYNFDMIQKTFPNNQTIYACSFECLKNSYKSMSRPIISSCSQSEIRRVYGNLKNLMTLSVARNGALSRKTNAATICYPIQKNASTSTEHSTKEKSSQTGNAEIVDAIVPLPVPMYVPAPVPLGQVAVPFGIPVPVPIPVPVFIPTGCRSLEEVSTKMQNIWKEVPQDPLQADLIILAKKLETNKPEESPEKPIVRAKRKIRKPPPFEIVKRDYHFGYVILKRWIKSKNEKTESNVFRTNILHMTRDELQKCLLAFLEHMNRVHSPGTIYAIFLDIQNYLLHKNKQEYIFLDASFRTFIETFNKITAPTAQNGVHRITSKLSEDYLWKTRQLGSHTPYTLLNSLIYFNYKLFGLKTVQEHVDLLALQITISKKPILNTPESKLKHVYRLKYFPKTFKPGDEAKITEVDKKFNDQKRCPASLYEFYTKRCPTSSSEVGTKMYYLKPELACEPDSPIWFSNQALDLWTIEMMLNRIKMIREAE